MTRPFDVIVVGAGVAGLFAATWLAQAGLRVCVLEGAARAGGRARSWTDAATGTEVDIGPHVLSTEHRNFLRMLERLGTAGEVAWQPDTLVDLLDAGERIAMANARWLPPFHGIPNLPQALRRLSWADLFSHLRVAWQAARANEATLHALDGRDALAWLRSLGVRERAIDWFWRSAVLALLNLRLEECSAAAVMRVFRLMLGRSGYHFGFPTTGLSRLYVPGCTAAIERAGGELRLGTPVHSLLSPGARMQGVRLRGGLAVEAPLCVLALPPPAAARLLARTGEPALQELQADARAFRGAPYLSTMVWLDRRVTTWRFWARVWNPEDLHTDFYDLANIRPELGGGGSVIAANAIGPQARPEWSDERIVARLLAELREFTPQAQQARVLHARVHRIRMAIPAPHPGTESLRPRNATPVTGLVLAGDWTDTAVPCSMESAARSAALAAEALLGTSALALPAPETNGLVGLVRQRRGAVGRVC